MFHLSVRPNRPPKKGKRESRKSGLQLAFRRDVGRPEPSRREASLPRKQKKGEGIHPLQDKKKRERKKSESSRVSEDRPFRSLSACSNPFSAKSVRLVAEKKKKRLEFTKNRCSQARKKKGKEGYGGLMFSKFR